MYPSIDKLINTQAKSLKPGESIEFKLVKGSITESCMNLSEKDSSSSKDRTLKFPLIAKFGESVMKPNFSRARRMHEEDIPKIKGDSDEDDTNSIDETPRRRKKRRYRRNDGPRQQWVIESNDREKNQKKSNHYIGTPESNLSNYVLLQTVKDGKTLEVVPIHGFYSFSQPSRVVGLSMSEAEEALNNQRAHLTRYVMHGKLSSVSEQKQEDKTHLLKGKMSKARLLNKFLGNQNSNDLEDNDIMGDLAYRNRRPTTVQARKELLADLADETVAVDQDGVLGGSNDAEFGGKRRFAPASAASSKRKSEKKGSTSSTKAPTSFEAAALDDDFYKRDVAAEYEDLDYDANEQFDDDDVDVQGDEPNTLEDSHRVDDYDDDDLDEYDDDNSNEYNPQSGLATSAGLKAMMAKARGDNLEDGTNPQSTLVAGTIDSKGKKTTAYNRSDEPPGSMVTSKQQEEDSSEHPNTNNHQNETSSPSQQSSNTETETKKSKKKDFNHTDDTNNAIEVDENGQRLITLQAIRREIWLHHGQIRMKRLMKIFTIKKNQQRYNKFRDLVKELCTLEIDKVEGNMLVLKQHWSNMG